MRRSVRQTLLIVAEGYADQAFVKHVRALYRDRISLEIKTKNAKGYGGRHVLDTALATARHFSFDHLAVMLDSDTDWGDKERTVAAKKCVEVVESNPCLEAWLLRVAGQRAPEGTPACKQVFNEYFGCDAHDERVFAQYFPRELLDRMRNQVATLGTLMSIMRIA